MSIAKENPNFVKLLEVTLKNYERQVAEELVRAEPFSSWEPMRLPQDFKSRMVRRGKAAVYNARMKLASKLAGYDVEDS